MRTRLLAILLVCIPGTAFGSLVSYDFAGTVSSLRDYSGGGLIPADVGSVISGSFKLDLSNTQTTTDTAEQVTYREMVVDFDLLVDGLKFNNTESGGIVIMRDDDADDDSILDRIQIGSPPLTGSGVDVWRMSFVLQDNSAEMLDSLSVDNLENIPFPPHDGVDHFRFANIVIEPSGSSPALVLDWDTLELSAVPEPSSLAVLLSGVVFVLIVRGRK